MGSEEKSADEAKHYGGFGKHTYTVGAPLDLLV
jgi:hypothetical protein